MQSRYTGDIGDFIKISILKALMPSRALGVAWWLYPDETHNSDGRHITYLSKPHVWRPLNPELFEQLSIIVRTGRRAVRELENVFPTGVLFAREMLPVLDIAPTLRPIERAYWLERVVESLSDSDFIFADPDNGLAPRGYRPGAKRSGKSILLDEVRRLSKPGRCLLVYHHQTRAAGGHLVEMEHWRERLRSIGFRKVDVLRARPFSPRAFFLLDAPNEMRGRAQAIEQSWAGRITWHPDNRGT